MYNPLIITIFALAKQKYRTPLAMNKNRQIISELQSFFKHNNASKAIKSITTVMNSLTLQSKVVGPVKNPNCKFTFVQVVKLLILFPFFSVKNAADYANSGLGKLFSCKKDMFYRLMDDGRTYRLETSHILHQSSTYRQDQPQLKWLMRI